MERAETSTPLKKLRIARGLSQKDLADAIGMDQSTIHLIENGKARNPKTAEKIAAHFDGAITESHILFPEKFPEYVASSAS